MAKPPLPPIPPVTPALVKSAVEAEDDFGFEMRVGAILRFGETEAAKRLVWSLIGMETISHGGTYTDPATNKPRQFDFRCQIANKEGVAAPLKRICLAVECKNLHSSAPLAICGRSRKQEESFYCVVVSEASVMEHRPPVGTVHLVSGHPYRLYAQGDFVGKSIVRLKSEPGQIVVDKNNQNQGDIYDRWSQAMASAVELAQKAHDAAKPNQRIVYSLILPIVVVPDGTLWKVEFDENGNISDAVNVDSCEYWISRELKLGADPQARPFTQTHVHFVTLSGFSKFLHRIATDSAIWINWFLLKTHGEWA